MAEESNGRISISRDALRADLAEMELRLRTWLSSELESKADIADLTIIKKDVSALQQSVVVRDGPIIRELFKYQDQLRNFSEGNFSEAQKRSFQLMMDDNLREHTDVGWTTRQRWIAVVALIVALIGALSSIILTIHYVG